MTVHVSAQTEARLADEAKRQGLSVEALLERIIDERVASAGDGGPTAPELPVLHLGPMGALHRRDICNDVS